VPALLLRLDVGSGGSSDGCIEADPRGETEADERIEVDADPAVGR
jgi:hypothetical protein